MRNRALSISIFLALIAFGAGAFLLVRGGTNLLDLGAGSKLEANIEMYRHSGMPWEASDLQKIYRARGSNGADLILQAEPMVRTLPLPTFRREARALIEQEKPEAFEAKIAPYRHAIDLAMEASARDCVVFVRDWDTELILTHREHEAVKNLIALLCTASLAAGKSRRSEQSLRLLAAGVRLAEFGGSEPGAIPLLLRARVQGYLSDAIFVNAICYRTQPVVLQALSNLSGTSRASDTIARALRFEAYTGIALLRNRDLYKSLDGLTDSETDEALASAKIVRSGCPQDQATPMMMSRYLEFWVEAGSLIKEFGDRPSLLASKFDSLVDEWNAKPSFAKSFSSIVLPDDVESWAMAFNRGEARMRVAGLWARAFLFEFKHGRRIRALDELGEVPRDPFRPHSPLLLKVDGPRLTIYSVGPDGRDDGGKLTSSKEKGRAPGHRVHLPAEAKTTRATNVAGRALILFSPRQ